MTYAILDNEILVATTVDLGDGFYTMVINGRDYITGNLKLWATEFGYKIEDIDDIEISIYPMFQAYTI